MLKSCFVGLGGTLIMALGIAFTMAAPKPVIAFPAADNVAIAQQCVTPEAALFIFDWTGYNMGDQWIDISLYDNGFANTFASLGPIPSNQTSAAAQGLDSAEWHYLRINTLTADGWTPSQTVAFFTPDCSSMLASAPALLPEPAALEPAPPAALEPAPPPAPEPQPAAQQQSQPPMPAGPQSGNGTY